MAIRRRTERTGIFYRRTAEASDDGGIRQVVGELSARLAGRPRTLAERFDRMLEFADSVLSRHPRPEVRRDVKALRDHVAVVRALLDRGDATGAVWHAIDLGQGVARLALRAREPEVKRAAQSRVRRRATLKQARVEKRIKMHHRHAELRRLVERYMADGSKKTEAVLTVAEDNSCSPGTVWAAIRRASE